MNVSLTPQLEEFVANKVSSGRYSGASEVVREALRLLEEQDRLREMRLADLRREVQLGIDDLEAGRYRRFENEAELGAYLNQLADEAIEKARKRKESAA